MRKQRLVVASLATLLLTTVVGAVPRATAGSVTGAEDGRIAFRDGVSGQIYTANPDGSSLQQVTHLGKNAFAGDPTWSPDGRRIALWIFRKSGALIYEMRADGSRLHPVFTDDPGYFDTTPGYTPDGKTIVFSRCQDSCAIYAVNTDGTDLTPLTTYRRGIHAGTDFHPRVSPDGSQIVFNRQESNGILSQIWLMNIDGSDAHPLTPARLEAGGRQTWSSDGRVVYFEAPARGFGNHLFRMTPEGEDVTQLTDSPFPHGDFDASGSPKGTRIAFISDRRYADPNNVSDLFLMRSDGTHERYVDTGLPLVLDPSWGTAPLQTGPSDQLPAWVGHPSTQRLAIAAERLHEVDRLLSMGQDRGPVGS